MQLDLIQAKLQQQFPNGDIELGEEGGHLNLVIVDDGFEGKRAVQRQQLVYAALNEMIADGSVHAVNMKTYTRAEIA